MKDRVQTQIDEEKYARSSDYVRDLIRKDHQDREKLAVLQAAKKGTDYVFLNCRHSSGAGSAGETVVYPQFTLTLVLDTSIRLTGHSSHIAG